MDTMSLDLPKPGYQQAASRKLTKSRYGPTSKAMFKRGLKAAKTAAAMKKPGPSTKVSLPGPVTKAKAGGQITKGAARMI